MMRDLRTRLRGELERLPFGTAVGFLLKGPAQVFAVRVFGAGLAYASLVLLARWLGSFQFGIYAYVSVIVMLLGIAMSFGFNASGLRFVSTYRARNKRARLAGFIVQSYKLVLLLSTVGALAAAGLVLLLRREIPDYYLAPLLIGLCCVPFWSLLNQLESTARAFGWLTLAYIPNYILRPFLLLTGVGIVLLTVGSADATTALRVLIVACATAVAVQAAVIYRRIRPLLSGQRPATHTRYWMAVSLGFLAIDGLRMLLENADVLLIGQLLDPHSVAVYYAVIRTGGLLGFISFSVTALAVPRFAQIHSTGSPRELQDFVTSTIRAIFWPTLLAAFALALLGKFVLALFGPGFDAGYPTLLVVLCGLVLRAASSPVEYLLTMTGHHRDTIEVYAGAAVATVILNLVLIQAFGLIGAAAASYLAIIGANVCLYLRVRSRLGVNACIFAQAIPSRKILAARS